MTRWNAHQKLARALRIAAHYEARVRATRKRRTPSEKKANSTARGCLARSIFAITDLWGAV